MEQEGSESIFAEQIVCLNVDFGSIYTVSANQDTLRYLF